MFHQQLNRKLRRLCPFSVRKWKYFRSGVPNLEYICLSEGVHLRISNRRENAFAFYLFPNIDTYISDYYFQKSLYCTLIVK